MASYQENLSHEISNPAKFDAFIKKRTILSLNSLDYNNLHLHKAGKDSIEYHNNVF